MMSKPEASSDSNPFTAFSRFVPGFDFLQQWTKTAGAALPGVGQWAAPTLDPAELDKRIQDLRTVQFWLEQNARMLGMTIQALEVQRMTLSTLQSMNVPIDNLRDALRASPDVERPASTPADAEATASSPSGPTASDAAAEASPQGSAMVDPMRWWGSLTQQFAQLATHTMQDAMRQAPPAAQASQAHAQAGRRGKQTDASADSPAARPAGKAATGRRSAAASEGSARKHASKRARSTRTG